MRKPYVFGSKTGRLSVPIEQQRLEKVTGLFVLDVKVQRNYSFMGAAQLPFLVPKEENARMPS